MNRLITAGKGFNIQLLREIFRNSWFTSEFRGWMRLNIFYQYIFILRHFGFWLLSKCWAVIYNLNVFIGKGKEIVKLLFITFVLIRFPLSHYNNRQSPKTLKWVFVFFTLWLCTIPSHLLLWVMWWKPERSPSQAGRTGSISRWG